MQSANTVQTCLNILNTNFRLTQAAKYDLNEKRIYFLIENFCTIIEMEKKCTQIEKQQKWTDNPQWCPKSYHACWPIGYWNLSNLDQNAHKKSIWIDLNHTVWNHLDQITTSTSIIEV